MISNLVYTHRCLNVLRQCFILYLSKTIVNVIVRYRRDLTFDLIQLLIYTYSHMLDTSSLFQLNAIFIAITLFMN